MKQLPGMAGGGKRKGLGGLGGMLGKMKLRFKQVLVDAVCISYIL